MSLAGAVRWLGSAGQVPPAGLPLPSLLAVTPGKFFALWLFLLSSPPPLSSNSLSVLSLSPELSCWPSRRGCPVLAPRQAPPVLSHCSDRPLRRVLSGHQPARQAVAKRSVLMVGCPCAKVLGRTRWALLALSWGGQAAPRSPGHSGQSPQPLEPPNTPVCNPGKLQLIEDAEDWQPRTGPSQSRSFRKLAQLMGTDGMEDREDVFVKKPSQVSVLDPSPGAAMKSEPGLAPRTPAATPGPASRPPWAVDPLFAERYAPDKTSTVVSKHSQPATPTPMQNRSSIVQAAQQAPEGPGRTPLCYKCNKVIRGRYLVALGHYYHPEEFTCCQCRKVLDEGGFFEEKGSIFCPKCYDTRYAPSCAKCKKKITGEVMHALKMTWHVQCFTCAACKTPIRNRAFYMEEGQPYCERDYEKMFGTKCRGCDFKIDAGDRFLEALGFSWHDTCFVCAICQTNLEGKTFYSKKDKPLCKSHAFSHV
ncbi:PDZ and LIM domain protein 7 isoform 4-T4 [Spheniscus humboldti]